MSPATLSVSVTMTPLPACTGGAASRVTASALTLRIATPVPCSRCCSASLADRLPLTAREVAPCASDAGYTTCTPDWRM
ncbi:hypothetical protein D3C81_405800 [compost metagenome]